jgi:HIRAN domain
MERREILKSLGVSALGLLSGQGLAAVERTRVFLIEVTVAGLFYYDGNRDEILQSFGIGDSLVLQREPGNIYDSNAIEIYTKNLSKLGYIPRQHNTILAALLDQNIALNAEVSKLEFRDWKKIYVKVYI